MGNKTNKLMGELNTTLLAMIRSAYEELRDAMQVRGNTIYAVFDSPLNKGSTTRKILQSVVVLCALALPGQVRGQEAFQDIKAVAFDDGATKYLVNFKYVLHEQATLFSPKFGKLPNSAEFTFLTDDPYVELRESEHGPTLLFFMDAGTPSSLEGGPYSAPPLNSFPAVSRHESWPNECQAFPESLFKVLKKWFLCEPSLRRNIWHAVTTFAELESSHKNTRAVIALDISYSTVAPKEKCDFELRYIVRERRTKSEWRSGSDVSLDTRRSAEAFVERLVLLLNKRAEESANNKESDK